MKQFLTAADVAKICSCSLSSAYKIIRRLNAELDAKGYIVLPGKVSAAYFSEKFYGGISE